MGTVESSGPWRLTRMLGGPFDGKTYRDRFPHGLLPTEIGLPCPTEPSGQATYRRNPAEPQDSDASWRYHYVSPWLDEAAALEATPQGTQISGLVRIAEPKRSRPEVTA